MNMKPRLVIISLLFAGLTLAVSACVIKPATPVNINTNINQNTNQTANTEDLITLTKDADGWKTYTNKDWGISFKFEDKNDESTISGDKLANPNNESNYIEFSTKNNNEPLRLYRGSFSDIYPVANNLEEYIVKYGNWPDAPCSASLEHYETIKINTTTGYKAYVTIGSNPPVSPCSVYFVIDYIYLNYSKERKYNRLYDYLEIDGTGSEDKTIFNQILETFQYLN